MSSQKLQTFNFNYGQYLIVVETRYSFEKRVEYIVINIHSKDVSFEDFKKNESMPQELATIMGYTLGKLNLELNDSHNWAIFYTVNEAQYQLALA